MMKMMFTSAILVICISAFSAERASFPFAWPTNLEYSFMPKQKMELIDGIVKNTEARALPDIDAKYSNKVKVDDLVFNFPGELCETMSACYKADLNGDKRLDYIFVNIKVWNGRYAGLSDVGVFVSTSQGKYTFQTFETLYLEAKSINGKIMLIKYAYSDDKITLIRQVYTFTEDGQIRLFQVEKHVTQ